jgi:hypothetical protein
MGKQRSPFPDLESLVRSSRLSLGPWRMRGVPAILAGVGFVILASGIARALERGVGLLPESLRQARKLWKSLRAERRSLRARAGAESLSGPIGAVLAGAEGSGAKRAQR